MGQAGLGGAVQSTGEALRARYQETWFLVARVLTHSLLEAEQIYLPL